MKTKPNKCKYIEGDQSALKAFALRVFGQIHEAKTHEKKEERPIYQEA